MDEPTTRVPRWEQAYLPVAVLLIAFGTVAILSIGLPFFILGTAMALLWPLRHRRRLFVSLLAGMFVFVMTGILLVPLGCTTTVTTTGTGGHTICDNIIGINYEGTTGYDAPLWPAVLGGAVAATVATLVAYFLPRRARGA